MIKRDILPLILEHLSEKEATVIIGPRQVGKTTILDQIEKHLLHRKKISKKRIFRFNLDIATDRKLFSSQSEVINFIKSRKREKETMYFFIDEVQRIENAGSFIKGIYDLNLGVKFILTGSSSLEIKAKIQESLTGRKKVFHVFPLTINEYLRYVDEELFQMMQEKNREIADYDFVRLEKIINDFSVFGGYPRVVLETNVDKKVGILEELYTSYLDKDIAGFLRIKKIESFSKSVSLLSAQVGNLLNNNKLARETGIEVKTLNEYLRILENTFVIFLLKPFFVNSRKEVIKAPKVYFIDNGLRNFAIGRFDNLKNREDRGAVFENVVATELIKNVKMPTTIHFWRTLQKTEVDFVLRKGDGEIIAMEVKAKKMDKITISRSYYSFLNKYSPQKALLVNFNSRRKTNVKDKNIQTLTVFDIWKEVN